MKKLFLLLFCLLIAACGESNPLIGKWEGSVDLGNDVIKQGLQAMGLDTSLKIQFTDKEMITIRGTTEQRQAVLYRVKDGKVSVAEDTGKAEKSQTWQIIPMKDKNTIEYPVMPGVKVTMTRVK